MNESAQETFRLDERDRIPQKQLLQENLHRIDQVARNTSKYADEVLKLLKNSSPIWDDKFRKGYGQLCGGFLRDLIYENEYDAYSRKDLDDVVMLVEDLMERRGIGYSAEAVDPILERQKKLEKMLEELTETKIDIVEDEFKQYILRRDGNPLEHVTEVAE